jgi:CDP-diacylglycerol--glycerol-3-phosphate 3-phosphatidyltransferase
MRINIPNQITLGRLGLAIVFVALLSSFDATRLEEQRWLLVVCFWVFLVAALADILDGVLARMLKEVTSFGRVLDPVVDKILVCSAFVLFASPHFCNSDGNITGVRAWMVVVILTRELLVSAVRSHAESGGTEFGAVWSGKLKMFVQSFAACAILAELGWNLTVLTPVRVVAVWATVVITAGSAVLYIHRARKFLLTSEALGGVRPSQEADPDEGAPS